MTTLFLQGSARASDCSSGTSRPCADGVFGQLGRLVGRSRVTSKGGATPLLRVGLGQPRPSGVAPPLIVHAALASEVSTGRAAAVRASAPMREHAEVLGHVKASLAALAADAALTCPARFRVLAVIGAVAGSRSCAGPVHARSHRCHRVWPLPLSIEC